MTSIADDMKSGPAQDADLLSPQHMAALVESADDAIVTKDLDGIIRSWNPAAERLLGYSALEMIGQPIGKIIPPDRQAEETSILDSIKRGERVAHFETVRRRKDGAPAHVSLTISPVRDPSGRVVGASKIMRDISARRRSEEQLRHANARLEYANQALDDFVYTASHDLRAPLNAVSSIANWIIEDDPSISASSRERLMLIRARIERMKKLLDGIRDYARAGQLPAPPQGALIAAAELVADVVATAFVPAGFEVRIDASLETARVHRVPLEQVLHNLINNALKHHDKSSGVVWVTVQEQGPTWRFSVSDDGPGIAAEYREAVFEMFKTLRPRDAVEGSGMGLALVKKIVGRLGGACGIEAAEGRGARVWFDWPRQS